MITNTLYEAAKNIANQVGANSIFWNRGELISEEWLNKYGEGAFIGSLYFCSHGIEYRISDHELQCKRYLQLNDNSFINQNIEIIFEKIPNGYILTNTFFNFNL